MQKTRISKSCGDGKKCRCNKRKCREHGQKNLQDGSHIMVYGPGIIPTGGKAQEAAQPPDNITLGMSFMKFKKGRSG